VIQGQEAERTRAGWWGKTSRECARAHVRESERKQENGFASSSPLFYSIQGTDALETVALLATHVRVLAGL
jgi:hypothetical protein